MAAAHVYADEPSRERFVASDLSQTQLPAFKDDALWELDRADTEAAQAAWARKWGRSAMRALNTAGVR